MILVALVAAHAAGLPDPLPATPWVPPTVQTRSLTNGVAVYALPPRPTGTFEVRLVVKSGQPEEPVGREGLAALAWDVADEAAGGRDAVTFSRTLRAAGASLTTQMQGDTTVVRIRGVTRQLDEAIALWASVVTAPTLSPADLDIARAKAIERVAVEAREPNAVADRVQAQVLYGDTYLGRSATAVSLGAITVEDVRTFLDANVRPDNAVVFAAGDVPLDELVARLNTHLGTWNKPAPPTASGAAKGREALAPRIVFAEVRGATQATMRAFASTVGPQHADRAALDVANEAIGGAFSSRINLNLREDKGWTYGARCRFVHNVGDSVYQCGALVRADVAGDALGEVQRELADFAGERPLTDEEATMFRTAVASGFAVDRESSAAMLSEVVRSVLYGLPMDQMGRYLTAVRAVTRSDAVRAVQMHLVPSQLTYVVAGDREAVLPQIEALGTKLGLPVVVFTP